MEDVDHGLPHKHAIHVSGSLPDDSVGSRLPNETLEEILLHVGPGVLATAARICHRWRAVAERLLYTHISVAEVVNGASHPPLKTIRACESLSARPDFKGAVKSFHVRWQSRPGQSPPGRELEEVFTEHVYPCLFDLQNIVSLELSLGGLSREFVESSDWRLFQDRTFPLVQQLSLTGIGNASIILHPDALPSLRRFRGGPTTAASIVYRRPVDSLTLVGNDSIPWNDLLRLSEASVLLRELDLTHMSVTPGLLQNISKYLSKVETLRLKLALRHTLHFAYSGVRLLAGLTPVLSVFSRLVLLDLSPTVVTGGGEGSINEELLLCIAWGEACPTLSKVIFPKNGTWLHLPDNSWVAEASV